MALFNRVTIVGLGLIGGSLGMAIRRKRLAREVVGLSRSMATVRRARARGAIDAGTTDPRRAVAGSDLVVIATPVSHIAPIARQLVRWMQPGRIVTDVGSTKAEIVDALEAALARRRVALVGAHPLAGSERRGIDAAQPGLFERETVIVTPTARTDRRALRRVATLWRRLGCRVVTMSPRRHDELLAAMSHLPHALASCLVQAVDSKRALAPTPSFLDLTRIAKSDPGLWDAIFLSNRRPVLRAMDQFERQWRAFRRDLQGRRQAALHRRLVTAQRKRLRWSDE